MPPADNSPSPSNLPSGMALHALLSEVQDALQLCFPKQRREWVRAEVVRVALLRSGHLSLELAEHDEQGQLLARIDAWIWKGRARGVQQRFQEATGGDLRAGIKILAQAGISYRPDKSLALTIDDIDPAFTIGDMEARLAKIREQLRADGIIDHNRRLPAPGDFYRVAVVSPASAAGLGDFRQGADALAQHGLCHFQYYPAPFQGAGVQEGLLQVLRQVFRDHRQQPFDALAIIRGGGSKADLYELNLHALANALCRMPLPVLVGVGHERDSTILDEVAWRSLATPSKVLQFIQESIVGNALQARQDYHTVALYARRRLEQARHQVERQRQAIHRQCRETLQQGRHSLERHLADSQSGARARLQEARGLIREWYATILGAGPAQALQRGYVIVRDPAGATLSRRQQAQQAPQLELQFRDGRLTVRPEPPLSEPDNPA